MFCNPWSACKIMQSICVTSKQTLTFNKRSQPHWMSTHWAVGFYRKTKNASADKSWVWTTSKTVACYRKVTFIEISDRKVYLAAKFEEAVSCWMIIRLQNAGANQYFGVSCYYFFREPLMGVWKQNKTWIIAVKAPAYYYGITVGCA